MLREELSQTLHQIGVLMELLGENPFKVRAHQAAARVIETFEGDLEEAITSGKIGELKGIGPAIKEKILEFYKTKKISEHESLKKKIPQGVLEMLEISGLGPKKVKVIYEKLGLQSVGELELACRRNRLVDLDGFGEKTQSKILESIEFKKKFRDKFLYSDAILEAQILVNTVKKVKLATKIEICGSLRRRKEIVSNINILASTPDEQKLKAFFLGLPQIEKIKNEEALKVTVVLKNGMPCELIIVPEDQFSFALLHFTGSKEHILALHKHAQSQGYELNESGLLNSSGSKALTEVPDEEGVYLALGLRWIPPELREDLGEIIYSKKQNLPQLVEVKDLKGIFHCHTTYSDGVNSLEEMVFAAQNLGYQYIGISDHSAASVAYANGLVKERVLDQFEKIQEIQKRFKIKIFKGIEADILSEGDLDYDQDFLLRFDFVIGSLHNALGQEESKMTSRVRKALENPLLDFFGHPTGRLLLGRAAAKFDVAEMINLAVKNNVVVELNANPQRLDLDWRYGKRLKELGGKVSVNPDAHSIAALEDVEFGINVARKGWLESEQIINTLPVDKVLQALKGYSARQH